ncbi:MAG TPA: SMC-Scp complex subunit ScpB [Candidatus Eisenbacteria bacterium]|nr:SMC-Scp complex subunit ScpB [Candidatus Eisenbacteria bacterium]
MNSQAAEILIESDDVDEQDGTEVVASEDEPEVPTERRAADAAADVARLVPLLEGILFAAGEPVSITRLVDALDGPDRREVVRALDLLGERLEEEGRGLRLVRVAGGYQLRTLAEHGPWIRRLLGGKPPRLSRAMLETLAIIAYRQPCTRPEIEAIRGVDVDAVLSTLLERRMIRIVGRKDAPGRPILYATTKEFLEVFSLPDLDALPPLKDLGELAEAFTGAADAGANGSGAGEPAAAEADGVPDVPTDREE